MHLRDGVKWHLLMGELSAQLLKLPDVSLNLCEVALRTEKRFPLAYNHDILAFNWGLDLDEGCEHLTRDLG